MRTCADALIVLKVVGLLGFARLDLFTAVGCEDGKKCNKSVYKDSKRTRKKFSRTSCRLELCKGFRAPILQFSGHERRGVSLPGRL
jgi:hypothetical protein